VDLLRRTIDEHRRLDRSRYNLSAATTAADGTVAAVSTACVIAWAISLVHREAAGRPALGGSPA